MAGDGLLVRVRPRLGRVPRAALLGLCRAALRHGNGEIDATSRAGLQIRGVREDSWRALIDALLELGLIDPAPGVEARAAVLVAPDHVPGDDTHRLAQAMYARIAELPELPGKVGFAIDAGTAPVLQDAPADVRIERGASGRLILRAEGRHRGTPLEPGREIDTLIALARWFVETGGADSGRMARHAAALPTWAREQEPAVMPASRIRPGDHPLGLAVALPFGRIAAAAFMRWLEAEPVISAVRVTPWRMLLCEAAAAIRLPAAGDALIVDPIAPVLRADACVGAPACPQANAATRALARQLAPHVGGRLHVSGCAKGCARAAPADVVLTARNGVFDLAFDARAGATPVHAGLDAAQILAHFGAA